MAIKITKEEYAKKFGSAPAAASTTPAPRIIPSPTADGSDHPILSALKGETSFPADTNTSNPLPNIARTVGNIPSSAAKLGRGIIAPVNPLDTDSPMNIGSNIVKSGSALTDIYRQQGAVQGTKSILGGFADTYLKIGEVIYGSTEKAYNALLDDPKKAISDTTTHIAKVGIEDPLLVPSLLYGGGKTAGTKTDGIASVAQKFTGGADTSIANVASKVAEPVMNAAESLTPAINKAGTVMKAAGEKATGVGVTMTVPTRMAVQSYEAQQPSLIGRVKGFLTGEKPVGTKPITEANTAVRNGLAGTEWQLGVQAEKASNGIWKDVVQPALKASKEKINKTQFFDSLRKRIIAENPDLTRRKALLEGLDAFAADYKNVNEFGLEKLQNYKEGWAKFVPDKAYKGQPIAGALGDVRNMAAQDARRIIYEKLGDEVKTAYLDYGNLQSIKEAGIKSVDALRSKGVSRQVWEAILDNAVTPVATFAGQVLYKTGQGFEMVGRKGAKTMRDLVK